ncbi:hypothetical protein IWW48_003122 [Coemansia sp. RSA 1200]|nr:hypothetical protein IWW48_003122 [Coemansia sp. RSA 1200]
MLRESQVELNAASLIDASDSSVAFSASLYFPNWTRRTVMFPFANVTVFHKGNAVGWLSTDSLEISGTQTKLYLSEVFHITDQDAMEHILRETAAIRRVAVDAKVVLDLSGVGKFLPTVTTHRKLDLTLPATPRINYTVHDINGPMIERDKGGVKVGALLHVAIPYNLSANIAKVCLDAHYANTTLAEVCLGPASIITGGLGPIPVGIHVREISGSAHEYALAKILRDVSIGNWPDIVITGSDPNEYTGAPVWLRRALHKASSGENVTMQIAGFPNCTNIAPLEASLRNFTKEVIVDMSKLKDSSSSVFGGIHGVLREVIFHIFNMAVEATVVNPVSGADVWLQSFKAVSYYDGDVPLGTIEHDFTLDRELASPQKMPNGLLLPFQTATTTPYMSVATNKTSIGWNVVRRAIGGTLDVDVFTNIQLLVGVSHLNLTLMGKNAPVKIRF